MSMFKPTTPPGQNKKKQPIPDAQRPTQLVVSPASGSIHPGDVLNAVIAAYNYLGAQVALPLDLAVANTNPSVANTVRADNALTITGTGIGTTAISVSSVSCNLTSNRLNLTNSAVVVPPDTTPASITIAPTSGTLAIGQTRQLVATVRNAAGDILPGVTVGWVSDDAPVASVNGSGLVTAVSEGDAHITAVKDALVSNAATFTVPAPSGGFVPDANMQAIIDGLLDGAELVNYQGVKPIVAGSSAAGNTALGEATILGATAGDLLSNTSIVLNVTGFTPPVSGTPAWARVVTAAGTFIADMVCQGGFQAGAIQTGPVTADTVYSLQLTAFTAPGGALAFTGVVTAGALRTTPELPRVVPNFDYLYNGYMDDAAVITLNPGELFRDAVIRGAPLMDPLVPKLKIKVPAGMEVAYQQNAWVPPNAAGWILFEADVALPATSIGDVLGNRIYETQAALLNLPWLTAPDYDAAISCQAGARGYAFRGFRVRAASTDPQTYPFIDFGGNLVYGAMTLDMQPSRISCRQLCLVGDQNGPGGHRRFGMRMNCSMYEVVDCVAFHINFSGVDYSQQEQSISQYEGLGKGRIKNVAGWGSTEPYAFGGAGHHQPFSEAQMLPTDITFEDCHFYRPFSKKGQEGSANQGEFKVGRRLHLLRCIFDGAWNDLQNGYALVAWSADPWSPWTQCSDLVVEDCWFKDCNSGFSFQNRNLAGDGIDPLPPRRLKVRNVLFTGFQAPQTYSPLGVTFGRGLSVANQWHYASFDRVTLVNASVAVQLDTSVDGQLYRGLKIRNCALQGYYFLTNPSPGPGNAVWASAAGPDCEFTGNLCSDSSGISNFPNPDATNIAIAADGSDFGFVDPSKVYNVGTRALDLDKCQIVGAHAGKGADAVTLKTLLLPVEIPLAYLPT